MGQEIFYCFSCQNRLMGSDLECGKAFLVDSQATCVKCVWGLLATRPDPVAELERLKRVTGQKSAGSSDPSAKTALYSTSAESPSRVAVLAVRRPLRVLSPGSVPLLVSATARRRMAERAYDSLKKRFQSGDDPPGTLLSERQLSGRLGMSKTPIKLALMRLEMEGFVTISSQGIVVRGLSDQEILDIFDTREALECYVAQRVAGNLIPDQVARLRQNLKDMDEAVRKKDVKDATRLDTEFHAALCDCLGNGELSQTIWRMREKLHRIISGKLSRTPDRLLTSAQEHAAIANAVIEGDGQRAALLIQKHLEYGLELR